MLAILNRVVDSLQVRICRVASASEWLLSQYLHWRNYQKTAEFGAEPLLIEVSGVGAFSLRFSGHRPYEFVLINPEICDIRIWNPDKWASAVQGQTGQLYIDFRSRFLQLAGIEQVHKVLQAIQAAFFGSWSLGWIRVSRIDLAADLQLDRDFDWHDLEQFVSRARRRDVCAGEESGILAQAKEILSAPTDNKAGATYNFTAEQVETLRRLVDSVSSDHEAHLYRVVHDRRPQTLYFGTFGGALYARIYDKLASLGKQNKEYMKEVWGSAGWDGSSPVWRFEFSLSGDFLKNAIDICQSGSNEQGEKIPDIRELQTCLDSIPSIWAYLTGSWLRYCLPSDSDSNPWRWELSPLWELLQTAFGEGIPVVRCAPPRQLVDEQLEAQLRGLFLTLAAKRSPTDEVTEAAASPIGVLIGYIDSGNFAHEFRQRRKLLGIDNLSDTHYSTEARKLRMLEGNGS